MVKAMKLVHCPSDHIKNDIMRTVMLLGLFKYGRRADPVAEVTIIGTNDRSHLLS